MSVLFAVALLVLAMAWLPLAWRFLRGWRNRKNPVSLAICAAIGLSVYVNVMLALALTERTSWEFFTIATRAFDLIVVANFYIAFHWSKKRFPEARTAPHEYSIPPTNTTTTPRSS
jgi:hypothetical protein